MYCVLGGGKTYTMVGTQDQPGIMVRALNQLFTAMEDDIESNHKVNVKPNNIKIPPPPSTIKRQEIFINIPIFPIIKKNSIKKIFKFTSLLLEFKKKLTFILFQFYLSQNF